MFAGSFSEELLCITRGTSLQGAGRRDTLYEGANFHPDVLRAIRPLAGAKEGVQRGNIGYYTVLYSAPSEEQSAGMAQATLEWLAVHDFCNPTNAVFCDKMPGKLRQLAKVAREHAPIPLVDDSYSAISCCSEKIGTRKRRKYYGDP